MEKIGVIGTGIMGSGIAKTLLKKGYDSVFFDRSFDCS
ncbi:MAG: NAD(P)-binding domain-containing protein, partial [Rectinema subterraneum]